MKVSVDIKQLLECGIEIPKLIDMVEEPEAIDELVKMVPTKASPDLNKDCAFLAALGNPHTASETLEYIRSNTLYSLLIFEGLIKHNNVSGDILISLAKDYPKLIGRILETKKLKLVKTED